MEKKADTKTKPFGIKDKIGYMFGDFGNDFTFIFASSFLMIFYTKVFGLSGALVGAIFLVSRIIDAFIDIGMGRLIDTLKPAKDGRFRPWIRRISIPIVISTVLMFLYVVEDWSYTARVIYAIVTYLIWGILYSAINIPYGSMAAVLSTEAGDRAALSTFRSIGATLAGLVISIITPLIIYTSDAAGNQVIISRNFTILAVVYGGLSIIGYTLCYRNCTERIQIEPSAQEAGQTNTFKVLLANRALLALIGSALLLLLATLMAQTMNTYLFMDYFKNAKILSVVGFVSTIAVLLVAPFAAKLSSRFGKKELGSISVLFTSVIYFLLFILRVKSITVFMVLFFLAALGSSIFNVIVWAFITDVIDYQEVKTHQREDGTIYAVYSFARKFGQALAGGIGGFALTAIGYVSDAPSQTQEVEESIYVIATVFPAIAYLGVGLILFFVYPLSKKRVEENIAELKSRHKDKNNTK